MRAGFPSSFGRFAPELRGFLGISGKAVFCRGTQGAVTFLGNKVAVLLTLVSEQELWGGGQMQAPPLGQGPLRASGVVWRGCGCLFENGQRSEGKYCTTA